MDHGLQGAGIPSCVTVERLTDEVIEHPSILVGKSLRNVEVEHQCHLREQEQVVGLRISRDTLSDTLTGGRKRSQWDGLDNQERQSGRKNTARTSADTLRPFSYNLLV